MLRNFPDLIEAYLGFTNHLESSKRLHKWSIISAIAGALERKTHIKRGRGLTLYPNLYIFIVGQSGIVKKSTSTGIAISLLKSVEGIKVMSDRATASSLIDQLGDSKKIYENKDEEYQHTSAFIYASELIVFLKEVFGTVTELLTTFYDCPEDWSYKTKNSGVNIMKNICVNMLAATTIQWLREAVSDQIMGAGFAGRIIFVCEKPSGRFVAWPDPPKDHDEMHLKLIEDLAQISQLFGEMKPSAKAKELFENWYIDHMKNIASPNEDFRMSGYYGRKGDMILKLSMVRSASLGSSLTIEDADIQWAIEQMGDLEKDIEDVYTKTGVHSEIELRFKILEFVRSHKKIKETYLRHYFGKHRARDVSKAIENLILEGVIFAEWDLKDKYFNFNFEMDSIFT